MAEHRIQADGLEVAVRTWGDPDLPTVVLVHGFPDTHAVWAPVAAALVDHGYRAVAYDVRGAGASDAPADLEAYALEHLVGDLAAVVDAFSPGRPVHLVGHDWGSIQGWHALADPRLAGRLATFTSISGPPLDHTGAWFRARIRDRSWLTLARQGVRSSYVGVFHLPGLPRALLALRGPVGRARTLWARSLQRAEGARTDDEWPAPSFADDVAHGIQLYRANLRPQLRKPGAPVATDVPVLLVLPTQDRFVPEWLFDGIEGRAPNLQRRHVPAGHWVVRTQPVDVATWVASMAESNREEEVPG